MRFVFSIFKARTSFRQFQILSALGEYLLFNVFDFSFDFLFFGNMNMRWMSCLHQLWWSLWIGWPVSQPRDALQVVYLDWFIRPEPCDPLKVPYFKQHVFFFIYIIKYNDIVQLILKIDKNIFRGWSFKIFVFKWSQGKSCNIFIRKRTRQYT